ncbi:DNA/RNA nuclease SfsA [Frisingicoccus sp.]|uniref:DNA/RNA nuclease SfsA n=1 Tax=Frisingicoccus sp. TaxID=1918627 RepID=UPI003AB31D45
MKYEAMTEGRFVRRRNRFIAEVMINGMTEAVHVRNTGRLRELFITDARVLLEPASNPERKTRYSLVCVEKNGQWVNVDSTAPNQIVEEMVRAGRLFSDITYVKREKTFGKSRFDLYVEHGGQKHYIEVKGVTLEVDGAARFPDAPTERGIKHIHELMEARRQGYLASIIFIIQMKGIKVFEPNRATHPAFAEALLEAAGAGVEILAFDCMVTENSLEGDLPVPVRLE